MGGDAFDPGRGGPAIGVSSNTIRHTASDSGALDAGAVTAATPVGVAKALRAGLRPLEVAARIAGHESTRTTQLYNRPQEEISLDGS